MRSLLISIDPGLHTCGMACWYDGVLGQAALIRSTGGDWSDMVFRTIGSVAESDLVIEIPQVYVRTRAKGDPNDLIQLAGLVGAFAHHFRSAGRSVTMYKPREWKGNVAKDITEHRARKRLTPDETKRVESLGLPRSTAHNVWDAVALGLFHIGR